MTQVKIYGERNSGNIYLEWLLKKNLEVEILDTPDLGWKHRIAPSSEELTDEHKKQVIFICLVKNPYSWLLSMHKRPYHHECLHKLSFSEFLKYSYGDYMNPIVMWNQKCRSYVNLGQITDRHMIVRYEDLLVDFKVVLDLIADKFGLVKPELYRNINNVLSHTDGINSRHFHKDFYLHEKWRYTIHTHHIEYINRFLDKELMSQLNYKLL